jgi:L-threonylcarbamoyladenylate synthase
MSLYPQNFAQTNILVASLSVFGDITEAASNLFQVMRYLDQQPIDLIIAEKMPNEGLGRAINDRLLRAAQKR